MDTEKCALVVRQIASRRESGRLDMQRLMYLLQRKGVKLGLQFVHDPHGPISPDLDALIARMAGEGSLVLDKRSAVHRITRGDTPLPGTLTEEEQGMLEYVLRTFGPLSTFELERAAMTDYAARTVLRGAGTEENIVYIVNRLSSGKFSVQAVQDHIRLLRAGGYIK